MAQVTVVGIAHSTNDPITYQGHSYAPQQVGDYRHYPALVAYPNTRRWKDEDGVTQQFTKIVKKVVYFIQKPELGQRVDVRLI